MANENETERTGIAHRIECLHGDESEIPRIGAPWNNISPGVKGARHFSIRTSSSCQSLGSKRTMRSSASWSPRQKR